MIVGNRLAPQARMLPKPGRPRGLDRSLLRGLLLLIGGWAVISLIGCTPLDRLAARFSDGVLQFASCHTVEANEIAVLVRSDDDVTMLEPIWLVEGEVRVRPGDVFTVGSAIDGLETVVDDAVPSSATEIYFSVGQRNETGGFGDVRSDRFFLADLREDEWTRSNGSRGDQPCE